VSGPYEKILALWADGGTGPRQTASVLVGRARILVQRMQETEDADAVPVAEAAVRELAALVEPRRGEDVRLASRAAEARAMLGELAARDGDAAAAADLFAEAAERYVAAGLPWFAVQYEARLAGVAQHLGDLGRAERAALAALEHGGSDLEPVGHAQLRLQLAELLGADDRVEGALAHALEAAHWADEAGEGPTLGAWARHLLGGFLLRLGRWAEAAEVLESALADLTAETHGDGALAQTLWWLGDCHTELGEHREAAERWLRAADIARHWPEQHDHAMLAHLTAEALARAGLPAEADRAYARAVGLWGELGNVHGYVRALRARAWYAAREAREGAEVSAPDEARELMGDAVAGCEAALSDVSGEENRRRIVAELGETYRQFGDLLARSVAEDAELVSFGPVFEEALGFVERAVAVYGSLGEEFLDARTAAELAAGWLEVDLRRPEAAGVRARGVLAAFGDRADDTAGARRAEAERLAVAAQALG
jgi:tetratricopeptide (TPR) repeat protein